MLRTTLGRLFHPRHPARAALLIAFGLFAALTLALVVRFASSVHALRDRREFGPGWSFPSTVYSDGLALTPGASLPEGYLRRHLELRGYVQTRAPGDQPGTFAETPGGFEIVLRGFQEAPDPGGHGGPERVRVTLAGGRVRAVRRFGAIAGAAAPDLAHPPRLEPIEVAALMDSHRVRRTWVPLARIPKVVRDAVVASEDRRFYQHLGLDVRSNVRALLTNVRARGVREGGSTITQQLARSLYLGRERTWFRKANEAVLAIGLEAMLSKDQILEMYLNSVYWGQDGSDGVSGIAEAARWYFDTAVDSLGLDEAALLAGIIPAPNAYSPYRNEEAARARRNGVLADMVDSGRLDARVAAAARRRPLRVRRPPARVERYTWFTDSVREALGRQLPRGAAERRGLAIFTTLDPVWQEEAEEKLADGVASLERWRGRSNEPLEGAFVAIEPATGSVRVVIGGRSAVAGGFNRAVRAQRQPGSAIKPVVYAAALDPTRGEPAFTPGSTVGDLRREFATPEGPWSPRNDEGDYHREVTLAKALAKSLNVATANLVDAVGPVRIAEYARRFGLGRFKPVASIGLGTNEVSLLALTDAFATFPNGGVRREPRFVRSVLEVRGTELLPLARRDSVVVIPAQTAALMTGLLEDVVIFGVSYPLRKTYGFTRPVGGKTGTTNDYLDAWFVGFTPDLAAGVWIGYDTPQNLARPAAETALPVWAGIMTRLLDGSPPTPFPERQDLELVWIDPWSGGLGGPNCPSTMRVPFVRGTSPAFVCTRDHASDWAALRAARAADSLARSADSAATAHGDSTESVPN